MALSGRIVQEGILQRHGKLICEVCEFDFKTRYGEIGDGYIEGHATGDLILGW